MADVEVVEIDDDDLYRHLRPGGHVKKTGDVSPIAFMVRRVPENEVSVDLAHLTSLEDTLPPSRRDDGWGVGVLKAAVPRGEGLEVRHDPQPDNGAHSLIIGMTPGDLAKCEVLAQETIVRLMPAKLPPPKSPT